MGFQTSLSIQFHSQSCGMVFRYTPTWIIPSTRHIILSHLFDKLTMVGFEHRFHTCSYLVTYTYIFFFKRYLCIGNQHLNNKCTSIFIYGCLWKKLNKTKINYIQLIKCWLPTIVTVAFLLYLIVYNEVGINCLIWLYIQEHKHTIFICNVYKIIYVCMRKGICFLF